MNTNDPTHRARRALRRIAADLDLAGHHFRSLPQRALAAWRGEHLVPQGAFDALITDEQRQKVTQSSIVSFDEDLRLLGKTEAADMSVGEVRAQAALVRGAELEERASLSVHLLLVALARKFTPPDVEQLVVWANDRTGDHWNRCAGGCRHFQLEHLVTGGCTRPDCHCTLPGVLKAPLGQRPLRNQVRRSSKRDPALPPVNSSAWWLEKPIAWFVGRHVERRFPIPSQSGVDERVWFYVISTAQAKDEPGRLYTKIMSTPRAIPMLDETTIASMTLADISNVWEEY